MMFYHALFFGFTVKAVDKDMNAFLIVCNATRERFYLPFELCQLLYLPYIIIIILIFLNCF